MSSGDHTSKCPWDADEWKRYGAAMESIHNIDKRSARQDKRLDRIEEKIDALNHIRKRGATAGAAGGGVACAFLIGVWEFIKLKVGV